MDETLILNLNIAAYALFVVYFYKRYSLNNLSTIASILYLLGSILSRLYYETPVFFYSFSNQSDIKFQGMLWLLLSNFLLINLLKGFGFSRTNIISGYNERFFYKLQVFIVVIASFSLIIQLPSAISNIMSGNLADIREATYSEGAQVTRNIFVNYIQRLFGGLNFFLFLIPAFNYFVKKRIRRLDIISIVVYFLTFVCTMGAYVSRAIIVFKLLECLSVLFLLKEYVEFKRIKYFVILLIPIGFILAGFFNAVTSSRFGDSTVNKTAENAANLRYAGEPMLNFMALMYDETSGCGYGYRSLPVFRKILGMSYFGKSGSEKEDNLQELDKIHPYPNFIFYTASGDLYLDWGAVIPIVFLLILNLSYYRFKNKRQGNFQILIWEQMFAFFVFYGVFYASYQNEASNFLIIYLFLFWRLFRNDKYAIQPSTNR